MRTERPRVVALLGTPTFCDLQSVFSKEVHGGTNGGYPPLLLLFVVIATRVYGSQRRCLDELRHHWPEIAAAYRKHLGVSWLDLPEKPPTAAQMDRFVRRVTTARDGKQLEDLRQQMTLIAIGQARSLGNLRSGVAPDFANLDPRHTIMGDGTWYRPFSDVQWDYDEQGEVTGAKGSRSRDPINRARVQQRTTQGWEDGKEHLMGINHVTVSTRTAAGLVVLAAAQALGAEVHTAKKLIEEVVHRAAGGVHAVIWDGALQETLRAELMSRHRVLLITKGPNRGAQRACGYRPPDRDRFDLELLAAGPTPDLPLGVSAYRGREKWDKINSKFGRLGQLRADGCVHDLWVDDGALVEVERRSDHLLWKTNFAKALSSEPTPGATGHALKTRWTLYCPSAGLHRFTTEWKPTTQAVKDTSSQEYALQLLQPIARSDHRFGRIFGQRNDTESLHSWIKAKMGTGKGRGRAQRLDERAQLLDHIAVCLLRNIETDLAARRPTW